MNKVFVALRKVRDEQRWEPTLDHKDIDPSSEQLEVGSGSTPVKPSTEPEFRHGSAQVLPLSVPEVGNGSALAVPAISSEVDSGNAQVLPASRSKKWSSGSARDQKVQGPVDERLVALHTPQTSAAEQYRKLYAEIIRVGRTRALRTILISSSLAGEGKTTSALNLAATIVASVGEHGVLIVDTDLRKPSVHTYLGARPECGLADYLRGDVEYSQIFAKTSIPSLTAVYAGSKTHNPFELLTSEKMQQFFEQLKSETAYPYIILDSSPVLLTSEPRALVQHVDTTLLVVRAKKTPKDLITQAIEALGEGNILGLVFNGVSHTDFHYYGYYHGAAYYDADNDQQR